VVSLKGFRLEIKDLRRGSQGSGVTLDGDEIRRNMLQIVYAQMKQTPEDPWVSREALSRLLGVTNGVLNESVSHFEGQGLLEAEGYPWETVRLSQKGVTALDARARSYCPNL
jgi:hypothetical protein